MQRKNRNSIFESIEQNSFDICIIGGGISGAGCALDAVLRGYKVILIEKGDFASETSSKSTKLIHGGVRYLEKAFKEMDISHLKQVRHGLTERKYLLRNAPHLAHPIEIVTPVFSWLEGLYYSIGLKLYSWIAGKDFLPNSNWNSRKKTFQLLPNLSKKCHSSISYYDGQMDDARYCISVIQSAENEGAVVINYAELLNFQFDENGKINGANILDKTNNNKYVINAKAFINCTGNGSDRIRKLANPTLENRIAPSKGVHIILPLHFLNSKQSLLIPKTKDDRMVFAIPFKDKLLVGTTDNPDNQVTVEPVLLKKEMDYLIETIQPYLSVKIQKTDVLAGFGGLRPLLASVSTKISSKLLRDHIVEFDETSQLISLMGGKWTTYRLMAKDAIDVYESKFSNIINNSITDSYTLNGGGDFDKNKEFGLTFDKTINECLYQHYGTNYSKVIEICSENSSLKERILAEYPYIKAQVIYGVRMEYCLTIRDFLARRIRLELLDWEATKLAIPIVADLMAQELGWSIEFKSRQIKEYQLLINSFQENIL